MPQSLKNVDISVNTIRALHSVDDDVNNITCVIVDMARLLQFVPGTTLDATPNAPERGIG